MYINVTTITRKHDEYEEEIWNSVEKLKRESEQREKDLQAMGTASPNLKSQKHINNNDSKGLDYSIRRTNASWKKEKREHSRIYDKRDTVFNSPAIRV